MTAATPALTPMQSDTLKEIANIGSGHAATVLSQLTGLCIMIEAPSLCVAPFDTITNQFVQDGDALVVLSTRMLGDVTGETYFLMSDAAASSLADLMLGQAFGAGSVFDELEQSSLIEAGNIIASSFMNALSQCIGCLLLPSVPTLRILSREDLTDSAALDTQSDLALFVETRFHVDAAGDASTPALHETLRGAFAFAPHANALGEIFRLIPERE